MKRLITVIIIGLFGLVMISHASEFEVPKGCPSNDYMRASKHEILVVGQGVSTGQSQERALGNLAMLISEIDVASYTQIFQMGKQARVYDQVHVVVERKMQNRFQYFETKRCKKGFVSYLAYDPRSLSMRLSDAFGYQYRNVTALPSTDFIGMYFSVSSDGQWYINQGNRKLAITYDEWLSLRVLPPASLPLPQSRQGEIRKVAVTTPDTEGRYDLIACDETGRCQYVGMDVSPQETVTITIPISMQVQFIAAVDLTQWSQYQRMFKKQRKHDQALNHFHLWKLITARRPSVHLAYNEKSPNL